jgi:hypothetical protein
MIRLAAAKAISRQRRTGTASARMSAATSTIANGAIDGLIASSSTGQPNRRPAAMKNTTHRSVLPTTTAPVKRGQFSWRAMIGHAHRAGCQLAMIAAVPRSGMSQKRKPGSTRKGANRIREIGGWRKV